MEKVFQISMIGSQFTFFQYVDNCSVWIAAIATWVGSFPHLWRLWTRTSCSDAVKCRGWLKSSGFTIESITFHTSGGTLSDVRDVEIIYRELLC